MKNFWLISLLTPILFGCANSNLDSPTYQSSPSEQFCKELKRNIIFNRTSSLNLGTASATQREQMIHLYEKHGCNKLEHASK